MESKFRERLKELRTQHGLTQVELAKLLDVSSTAVSAWELGRNCPDHVMLMKICLYFQVTTDYIIGFSEI